MELIQQQANQPALLPIREWIAALLMLLILSLLTTVSFVSKWQSSTSSQPLICVHIVGAVEKEQDLNLPHGASIADALSHIALSDDAAVEKMAYDAPLRQNQILIVPKKKCVSVFVKGAVVKAGLVVLPEGATFRDLALRINVQENADIKSLKRKKRRLKDGEVITISCRE